MIPIHVFASLLSTGPALPSFSVQQSALVPLVIIALLIDSLIIAIWFALGFVLGNSGVKTAARAELYQLIGTAIIMVVVIFALVTFSGVFQSALSGSPLLGASAMSTLCNNLGNSASDPVDILTYSGGFSNVLCSVVDPNGDTAAAPDFITQQIDYPLAASGMVLENLTYQSVVNLNSLFVFDSYLGFLQNLKPDFSICVVDIVPSTQCLLPPIPDDEDSIPAVQFTWGGQPYLGMEMIYRGLTSMAVLFTTAVQSFILQLTFISIFLYTWPFLIFTGLVLRATIFTRKIGGLFIAVAIGAVFFYPLVFSIQYLTLGRGLGNVPVYSPSDIVSALPNSISTTYGYNGLTSNALTALPGSCGINQFGDTCGTYTPNFYVLPSIAAIVQANGCWPPGGQYAGAIGAEAADIATQLIPFLSLAELAEALVGGFVGGYPVLLVPFQCLPYSAESALFMIVNAYGVYGVSAYLLPILDIMITMSAIIGLSDILGGDTDLAGLAKLV